MTPSLPLAFLKAPIAHRAYHDRNLNRPENSRAAVRAAINAGYGIEIDLQLSLDDQAMVFHDYDLARLTGARGPLRLRDAADLATIPLNSGDGETIPTLPEILEIIAGQVPLLIEIKDQDGAMGPAIGPLETALAKALHAYRGPVAVMSFNPHAVKRVADLAPDIPRGLTTCDYDSAEWPLTEQTCARLRRIEDFDNVQASFISHQANDLARRRVKVIRKTGTPVLCWTIRSPQEEAEARKLADNVTFEGYAAEIRA